MSSSPSFFLSYLYKERQAEKTEIEKHKWIESEKVGYDIGWKQAQSQWIIRHRYQWIKTREHYLKYK